MKQSTYCYPLCASEDLQIEDTGKEVIVFDPRNKKFHFLNETAHDILKACNGTNSIRDIAVMLSANLEGDDADSIIDDVTEVVANFQAEGLIMFVADELTQVTSSASTDDSPLLAVSVSGTSMFPTLLSGDKALVKKSPPEELSVGDIIVWTAESDERVAHRILSIASAASPPVIITKGDLTIATDPPVEFERVIGKVVAVLRDSKVHWISELNGGNDPQSETASSLPKQRPTYKNMQVLDLREISVESIRNIGAIEQIGLVLLSPENAHVWSEVNARGVSTVVTAPPQYRVYTGQPELLPEMLEFLDTPLRLIVSGQLFLTAFEPEQIAKAFNELILIGQAYVSSVEAKTVLQSLTNIISGEISVIPIEHTRWIGQSILGPEYLSKSHQPLVVVGDLATSERMENIPDSISLFR